MTVLDLEKAGSIGGLARSSSAAKGATAEVPDIEALLLLESPYARMPYEDLRRRMRVHQRITETHFAALAPLVRELENSGSLEEAEVKIGTMIDRVKAVKEKLTPLTSNLESSLDMLQKRTSHLSDIHQITTSAAAQRSAIKIEPVEMDVDDYAITQDVDFTSRYEAWSDVRLHRMITDWLLRRGYIESAQAFVESLGIEAHTDLPVFKELFAIRASLIPAADSGVKPSCTIALAWCLENKVALRRFKSTLEFDLRMQEFIDLCKIRTSESLSQAIAYSRKHLLPLHKVAIDALAKSKALNRAGEKPAGGQVEGTQAAGEDNEDETTERAVNEKICERVSRMMGLLAVGPGGWAYEEFYSSTRYSRLYESLLSAALHIYSLPPQPLLHIALSAGLSSLKVPACYGGEKAPTTSATSAGNAAAAATVDSQEFGSTAAAGGTEPGEIDEELMRDVRREVQAEHVKHEAESSKSSDFVDDTRNNDCPVCAIVSFAVPDGAKGISAATVHRALGLGVLAKEVPWSHHSNSVIVCRISGKVIDDSDEGGGIVALPNGRVYSKRALEEASVSLSPTTSGTGAHYYHARGSGSGDSEGGVNGGGFVTCPRTRTRYPRSSMRKVYIS